MKSSKCKQEQEQMLPLWQDIFKRKQFEEEVNIRRRTPQLPTTFNPCVNCTTQTSDPIIRLLSVHRRTSYCNIFPRAGKNVSETHLQKYFVNPCTCVASARAGIPNIIGRFGSMQRSRKLQL